MNLRKDDSPERKRKLTISWLERIAKGKKSTPKTESMHCGNYSSVVCLRCNKCWEPGTRNKKNKQD